MTYPLMKPEISADPECLVPKHPSIGIAGALLLLVIAIHAPFLNQAFHMDDGLYLRLAHGIQHNGLFPQDAPMLFEGLFAADAASTEHPWPLTPYLLALCSFLGGNSEWCLHAGFLVFPIVLAWSMYVLSLSTTRRPVLAVLTLLSMPVVYVNSHTLMTDIPLLSLWLASIALFHRGVRLHRVLLIWCGTAVSAIALLLSYAAIGLILLLVFYGILRRNRFAAAIVLSVPACAFGIWAAATFFHYHRFAPGTLIGSYLFMKRIFSPDLLAQKFASIVLSLGGITIFPFILPAVCRKRSLIIGLLMAGVFGLIFGKYVSGPWQKTMLILFFFAGFAAISEVFGTLAVSLASMRSRLDEVAEDLFLSLWFAGSLAFCWIVYMTGSGRYILPALPPLVLILLRRIQAGMNDRKARLVLGANVALSGALALSLAYADYQFSGIYRRFASSLRAHSPAPAGNLWFAGEWGLRAYLEEMGGKELGRRDARAKPGDLLIVPRLATPYQTLYDKTLGLRSIAMVAPSDLIFDIPAVPVDSTLICTIGLPYYARSDGLEFSISFRSKSGDRILYREHVTPEAGRRWQVRNISLDGLSGERGAIVFASKIGSSGNADADWLALARARLQRREGNLDIAFFDFLDHIHNARAVPVPGIQYHTEGNRPTLSMTAWLDQEPAAILRKTYDYDPAFRLRLLEERSHAGFWGSSWGLLPFSFAAHGPPLERISVYEITRTVDAYGESTPSWYER